MKAFIILGAMVCACLISFITVPLFAKKISKFWLYFINTLLGAVITLTMVEVLSIEEKQTADIIPYLIMTLAFIVLVSKKMPHGEEFLKTWYEVDEDGDDREYFSQKDMHGKPWWKFMFIPGWITVLIAISWIVGSLLFWSITGDYQFLLGSPILLIVLVIIIRDAKKRKKNYDKEYK